MNVGKRRRKMRKWNYDEGIEFMRFARKLTLS